MPGILPMKVIKVGTSSQSRIAQACDRCRSKKIRCDGIRPCCSQCANVGFECKTSDKLSRRAFPRGYTESLEERVRTLEGEVRELKDLLDEKDEKIDMLSKMHSNRRSSITSACSPPAEIRKEMLATPPKEDVFRVQASPLLLGVENSDSYFMGASSGRAFVGKYNRTVCRTYVANHPRCFQAQSTRNWKVGRWIQHGGIPECTEWSYTRDRSLLSQRLRHTASHVLRSMCQRLLPGMGTSISCPT